MKVAVSNLAWDAEEDERIAHLMRSLGIAGLEIAPTRIWDSPLDSSKRQRSEVRRRWHDRGIAIVSLQALLFGRPDLVLFESEVKRQSTLDYLRGIIELAADLGATRLVFGSPRNRAKGPMTRDKADELALLFFRAIGDSAVDSGVVFCLEPNPAEYDCDWITTVEDGHRFVTRVGHPGIGLNADSGGITLAGEDPATVIRQAVDRIAHIHISEPQLAPIGTGGVDHARFAEVLRANGYTGWVSVEMRPPPSENRALTLEGSFRRAVGLYGASSAPD